MSGNQGKAIMRPGISIAVLLIVAGLLVLGVGRVIQGDDHPESTLCPTVAATDGEPTESVFRVARSRQGNPEPESGAAIAKPSVPTSLSIDARATQARGIREITGHLHFVDKNGLAVFIGRGELRISLASPSTKDEEELVSREFRVPFEGPIFSFQLQPDEQIDEVGPAFEGPFEISSIAYDNHEITDSNLKIDVTLKTSDIVSMRIVDAESGEDLPIVRLYTGSMILGEVATGRYSDGAGFHLGSEPILVTSSPLQFRSAGLSFVTADAPGHASVEFQTNLNEAPLVVRLPREGSLDLTIDADWNAVAAAGDLVLRVGRSDHADLLVPLQGRAQEHVRIEGLPPGEVTVGIETPGRGDLEGYELSYLYPWPIISPGETTLARLGLRSEILRKTKKDVTFRVSLPPALAFDSKSICATLTALAPDDDVRRNLRFETQGNGQALFTKTIGTWPGHYVLSLLGEEIELEVPEGSVETIEISFPDRPPLELVLRDPKGRLLTDDEVVVKQMDIGRCKFSPTHRAHLIPLKGLALKIRRRNAATGEMGPVIRIHAWRFAALGRLDLVVPPAHRLDVWFRTGSKAAFITPELTRCIRVLNSEGHPVPPHWNSESKGNRWWLEEEGRFVVEFIGNPQYPPQRKVIEVEKNSSVLVRFDLPN